MPQAPTTEAAPKTPKKLQHIHPDGRLYFNQCRACREEDRARSGLDNPHIKDEDIERTTFLIPHSDHDGAVCRAYLDAKYPEERPGTRYVGSTLDTEKLGGWVEGEQLVIVRIDTWPKPPSAGTARKKDQEDKWETVTIPYEDLIHEVVESAPIEVRKIMTVNKADRFTKSTYNKQPFYDRLSELMPAPYQLRLPMYEGDTLLWFGRF